MDSTEFFRQQVREEVTRRVALEARAGFPQGLVDRRFEDITAELMFPQRWEHLTFDQAVRRICGLERKQRKRRVKR